MYWEWYFVPYAGDKISAAPLAALKIKAHRAAGFRRQAVLRFQRAFRRQPFG